LFTVIAWREQAEHAAESLSKGSRVVVMGWAAAADLDRSGRQRPIHRRGRGRRVGPSLRWAAATTTRTTQSR
jgi:single-strand DNA-binding protein